MKVIEILFSITLFIFCAFSLKAQESLTEPWNYTIDIELDDSTLLVNLSVKISKITASDKVSFLFNRYIQIEEALIDDSPLIISRSNDTLYFETGQKKRDDSFYEI